MGRLEASILSSLEGVSTPVSTPTPMVKEFFMPLPGSFLKGSESWSSQEASERTYGDRDGRGWVRG